MRQAIHDADLCMLWNEKRALMAPEPADWGLPKEMRPVVTFRPCLQPLAAKDFFLLRFKELTA